MTACNAAKEPESIQSGSTTSATTDTFLSFNKSKVNVYEADTNTLVNVLRTGSTSEAITAKVRVVGNTNLLLALGTITANNVPVNVISTSPYIFEVPMPANATFVKLLISFTDNTIYEATKLLTFQLMDIGTYDLTNPAAYGITILNDDTYPVVSFGAATTTIGEGASTSITLSLSNASGTSVYVPLTISGTSISSDHNLVNQIITFAPGVTTQNITVNASADAFNEVSETIIVSMGPPSGASIGAFPSETVTITDVTPVPQVNFLSAVYSVDEIASGTTTVVISAQLTGTLQQQISVPLTIPTGTAMSGTDYIISGNNFIFPAGVLNPIATITITTNDDNFYESNETIILNLTATTYSTLGGTFSTTVTVVDNETAPQIGFIEAAQSTQEASTYYLTVIMNNPSSQDHVVTYTINASSTATQTTDYVFGTLPTGTITVPAGVSMVQIPITITQDNQLDDNETISIKLTAPTNGATLTPAKDNIIVTIREASSLPKISFQINNQIGDEGTIATVNVLLSSPSEYAINFTMMTNSSSSSASDYTSLLTHTIPASATSYSFNVTLVADGLNENEEEVTLLLLQPSNLSIGSISSHRIRIRDMDAPSTATLASTIVGNILTEGDPIDPNAFTITLNAASSFNISIPYTISGTATALTDHDLITGIAVIPAGSLSVNIALEAYNDNFYESAVDETLIITLGSGPHYTLLSATETISIIEANAIPTANFLSATLTHNENDIISLPIVLSAPTAADTVVNYIIDYSVCVTCATANDHTLVAGSVTILEGQTLGVVSFQIKNDSLYEGPVDESFRVTLASTNDPLMALIGATNDVDITIVNIDPIPQVYFSEMTKSKLEGTPVYTVPFYLSHGSTFPIVVSLDLVEGATTYKPNQSDLNCPTCAAAVSPSIYTANVTFAPETITAGLDITINNDALYEGPEEFIINMTGAGGGATINPAANSYTMMILDDETYPVISVNFAAPSAAEGTAAAYNLTSANLTVSLSVMCEHITVNSWLLFNGTAKYVDAIDLANGGTPTLYQTGDYRIDGTLSFFYPSYKYITIAPMVINQTLTAKIAQDSKYEYNETIVGTLTSPNNATLSPTAGSASFTILNDDVTKPNLYLNATAAIAVTMKEYDSYSTGISLYVADPTKTYTGEAVTERPINVSYAMRATLRAGGTIVQTGSILLNTANLFTANVSFNSSLFAVDKRSILDIDFFLYNPDEALIDSNLLSAPYYVMDGTYLASYTGNIALEYDDLEIGISRGSTTSLVGTENHLEGHSCTLYRGLVSCFGRGTDGQLGRGNANFYGRDLGENVALQANVISLGTEGGFSNYATQVALGTSHSCALFSNNKMKCWGNNSYGQLGLGSTQTTFGTSAAHMGDNLAYLDLGTTDTITSIHAMHYSTCAVFSTGKAKCWGKNDFGQLGLDHTTTIGTTSAQMGTALAYVKGVTGIELFVTGGNHACATTSSTTLRCWGYNTSGQLGLNKVYDSSSVPTYSVGGIAGDMALTSVSIDNIGDIVSLTAGRDHTCATFNPTTKTTFNTRCWGDNFFGQLGISRTTRGGEYINSFTACDWFNTNCTDALGRTWSSTTLQSENIASDGHSVLISGIRYKPHTSTSAGNYLVDFDIPNNQFVQLTYPIYDMAAGDAYT